MIYVEWTDKDTAKTPVTTGETQVVYIKAPITYGNGFSTSPYATCANNPANNPFASGFCHCILGTPTIY